MPPKKPPATTRAGQMKSRDKTNENDPKLQKNSRKSLVSLEKPESDFDFMFEKSTNVETKTTTPKHHVLVTSIATSNLGRYDVETKGDTVHLRRSGGPSDFQSQFLSPAIPKKRHAVSMGSMDLLGSNLFSSAVKPRETQQGLGSVLRARLHEQANMQFENSMSPLVDKGDSWKAQDLTQTPQPSRVSQRKTPKMESLDVYPIITIPSQSPIPHKDPTLPPTPPMMDTESFPNPFVQQPKPIQAKKRKVSDITKPGKKSLRSLEHFINPNIHSPTVEEVEKNAKRQSRSKSVSRQASREPSRHASREPSNVPSPIQVIKYPQTILEEDPIDVASSPVLKSHFVKQTPPKKRVFIDLSSSPFENARAIPSPSICVVSPKSPIASPMSSPRLDSPRLDSPSPRLPFKVPSPSSRAIPTTFGHTPAFMQQVLQDEEMEVQEPQEPYAETMEQVSVEEEAYKEALTQSPDPRSIHLALIGPETQKIFATQDSESHSQPMLPIVKKSSQEWETELAREMQETMPHSNSFVRHNDEIISSMMPTHDDFARQAAEMIATPHKEPPLSLSPIPQQSIPITTESILLISQPVVFESKPDAILGSTPKKSHLTQASLPILGQSRMDSIIDDPSQPIAPSDDIQDDELEPIRYESLPAPTALMNVVEEESHPEKELDPTQTPPDVSFALPEMNLGSILENGRLPLTMAPKSPEKSVESPEKQTPDKPSPEKTPEKENKSTDLFNSEPDLHDFKTQMPQTEALEVQSEMDEPFMPKTGNVVADMMEMAGLKDMDGFGFGFGKARELVNDDFGGFDKAGGFVKPTISFAKASVVDFSKPTDDAMETQDLVNPVVEVPKPVEFKPAFVKPIDPPKPKPPLAPKKDLLRIGNGAKPYRNPLKDKTIQPLHGRKKNLLPAINAIPALPVTSVKVKRPETTLETNFKSTLNHLIENVDPKDFQPARLISPIEAEEFMFDDWGWKQARLQLLDGKRSPTMATEAWVQNHYRWIVWLLSWCEAHGMGECLSKEMVYAELEYRYEYEVEQTKHSPFKLMTEEGIKNRLMMVWVVETGEEILVMDGWYQLHAKLDSGLNRLLLRGKLLPGSRLWVLGARLSQVDQRAILEVGDSMDLNLSFNVVRLITSPSSSSFVGLGLHDVKVLEVWDSMATSYSLDGGKIPLFSANLLRVYPKYFVEFVDGHPQFLTPEENEDVQAQHEAKRLKAREKFLEQAQKDPEEFGADIDIMEKAPESCSLDEVDFEDAEDLFRVFCSKKNKTEYLSSLPFKPQQLLRDKIGQHRQQNAQTLLQGVEDYVREEVPTRSAKMECKIKLEDVKGDQVMVKIKNCNPETYQNLSRHEGQFGTFYELFTGKSGRVAEWLWQSETTSRFENGKKMERPWCNSITLEKCGLGDDVDLIGVIAHFKHFGSSNFNVNVHICLALPEEEGQVTFVICKVSSRWGHQKLLKQLAVGQVLMLQNAIFEAKKRDAYVLTTLDDQTRYSFASDSKTRARFEEAAVLSTRDDWSDFERYAQELIDRANPTVGISDFASQAIAATPMEIRMIVSEVNQDDVLKGGSFISDCLDEIGI